jgi:hypothetical protein
MADGLATSRSSDEAREWVERTRDIDEDLDHAWALVRQAQESARMNPRRSARSMRDPRQWHELLRRLEQSVAETRSLARTLGAQAQHSALDEQFAHRWIAMLREAGRAAVEAEPAALVDVRRQLQEFADEMRSTERSPQWPVYGALIINLRNIVDALDEVAAANPIRGRPLRLRIPRRPGGVDRA